ncbi:GNAT family N-acetyltransferase [Mangrovibacterium lignilyticum]|uniref:GNAT family N-acetyltransferase n=1 Tax=Mangrovibacterium lignilyticum TaxID=2668052 RepID=UPI0013D7BF08|nr:GNAT family N-acetyltransferase [Mangrovibacterium lignilyticum]
MQLKIVDNAPSRKLFHKVPHIVYKGDPNWAPPIEGMIEDTFSPEKNPSFKNGEAIRWVLTSGDGKLLGRIGAFINYDKSNTFEQPTGGCGFFECVDDQKAANKLFNAARDWLKERNMEAMDGPVNFGENYMNWGLLVDGFMPQGFGMPYNPKYYQKLFEEYGFKMYFQQFSYHLDTTLPELPDRFWKVAEWVAKKPQFRFEHFSWDKKDQFIDDFATVYDNAWRFHEHFKPLDKDDLRDFLKSAKPILEPEFIWFAYHEDEPIALFVMVPDLNQILIKMKGKLNLWGILKFMWLKKRKTMTRTRSLIIGIVPKFQRSGVDAAMFWHLRPVMYRKNWYKEMELSWAGDFNPKVVSLYESVGGKHTKTHYTMRYLFDRNKPFERAPIINAEKVGEKK